MLNEKASIVCFEQFIEAFLTESSKSPAKQLFGAELRSEADCEYPLSNH